MTEPSPPSFAYSASTLLTLFSEGTYEIEGRMADSSNVTLLVTVRSPAPDGDDQLEHRAIYKPVKGERPLADFPPGLHTREVAMYRVADALNWDVVPPTALVDGPFGEGSTQAFVDANFEHHYFSLLQEQKGIDDLKKICALDYITNNTDRKSGHCLQAKSGQIFGIDHGLTFHAQFKLRTVIWDFAGLPIPEPMLSDIDRFVESELPSPMKDLLTTLELDAMFTRAKALRESEVFPSDDTDGHRWPWPLV